MTETAPVETSDTDRNWEALRAKAAEADQLKVQVANLSRKDAFRDAGLDLTNPLHAAVMNGYDGEHDPVKVREFVTQTGVLATATEPAPPVEDPAVTEARDGMNRIGDASQTATTQTATAQTELDDIDRQARTERWSSDRYNAAITTWGQKHGLPTMYDGV